MNSGNMRSDLELIREMVLAVSQVFGVTEVVQVLLDRITGMVGARAAELRLLSPDANELALMGAVGLSDTYRALGPVLLSRSEVARRVIGGESVVVADVGRETGIQFAAEAAREGFTGMVSVPLSVRGRVVGILKCYIDDAGTFGAERMCLLQTLCDIGAVVVDKAHLHQTLFRIAGSLNTSLELPEMLHRVLDATVLELGIRAASVRLLTPDTNVLKLVAARGLSREYLDKGQVHVELSPMDQRVLQGETVVLFDVENEPGFEYPAEASREGIRSVLAVPLHIKERMLGVMRVYSVRPRHFGPVAISLLESVADLVALAIENAELYGALKARYEDLKVDLADWYRFLALG